MTTGTQAAARIGWSLLLSLASLRGWGAADGDLEMARRLNAAFVQVAETVSPAVVVVRVQPKRGSGGGFSHDGLLEFLPEEMRKELLERMEQEVEQGSGIIIREDGYILTNGHVVENAERIEVRLLDGRRFTAEVKGVDTDSDLAILKVEGSGLAAAKLGDSSKLRVGEFAIAIGAPFELDYSVTFGHVSAKGRRVLSDSVMMDQDFIQTDASINPGNSGGPLVNIEGEVIGVNTMIHGLNTGIGFAVPINLAREVAGQLIETGRFARAWLGINILTLGDSRDLRPANVPVAQGVLVTRILQDGPSWGSELAAMDVIVSVEGEPVRDDGELKRLVSRRPAGKPMAVEVYRGAEKLRLTLTPGELPADRMMARLPARPTPVEPEDSSVLGLTVRDLDSANARRVGLEQGEGVLVAGVADDSPAAARRIQPGEVITKVNRRVVRSPREFAAAVAGADLKRGVSMIIVGESGRRYEILKEPAR